MLCACVVPAVAQDSKAWDQGLLQLLTIPNPECELGWYFEGAYIDTLLANPRVSLDRLQRELRMTELRNEDEVSEAKLVLDIAEVYLALDSLSASKSSASRAIGVLQRAYGAQPSPLLACQIGRCCRILDESAKEREWYERAITLDEVYAPAYNFMLGSLWSAGASEREEWIRRAESVTKRLLATVHDPKQRAAIIYENAVAQMTLQNMQYMEKYVGFVAVQMHQLLQQGGNWSPSDSTLVTGAKNMFGPYFDPDFIRHLADAAELDPTNVRYAFTHAIMDLGRIFFSSLERMVQTGKDSPSLSTIELWQKLFDSDRESILAIRGWLMAIPYAETERFPAVNLYRAVADAMLGEYRRAYDEIGSYIEDRPDDVNGYTLQCGIVATFRVSNTDKDDLYFARAWRSNEWKCRVFPTAADCYRFGYIQWYASDYQGCQVTFQKASLLKGKDVRPMIAMAVAAMQSGNADLARTIARTFKEDDLGGDVRVAYDDLRAVLAAYDGDLAEAISWAQKAVAINVDVPEAKQLLEELRKR